MKIFQYITGSPVNAVRWIAAKSRGIADVHARSNGWTAPGREVGPLPWVTPETPDSALLAAGVDIVIRKEK